MRSIERTTYPPSWPGLTRPPSTRCQPGRRAGGVARRQRPFAGTSGWIAGSAPAMTTESEAKPSKADTLGWKAERRGRDVAFSPGEGGSFPPPWGERAAPRPQPAMTSRPHPEPIEGRGRGTDPHPPTWFDKLTLMAPHAAVSPYRRPFGGAVVPRRISRVSSSVRA